MIQQTAFYSFEITSVSFIWTSTSGVKQQTITINTMGLEGMLDSGTTGIIVP